MSEQQQAARDAAKDRAMAQALKIWQDDHRDSYEGGYPDYSASDGFEGGFEACYEWLTAAKGESVTVKGKPPPRDLAQNIAKCSTYDLFFAADEALRNDTEPWFLTDAKALLAEPQQPDPAESTDAFEITEDEIKAVPSGDPAQWETSMRELCQEIEKLPASEQQTAISVKASAIYQSLAEFNRYCNAQFEDMRQKHPDLFKKSAGSTDADKGVCECGHFDTNHASRYGECFKCADKCGKPTAPPEQGEVCETCEHPKCNHEFADVLDESDIGRCFNGCGCRQFKPATPPASEPSRDAMVELINNEWVKYINDTGGRKVEEWFADFCLDQLAHFAGQRAEVAHEHNALCTAAYNDGQRAERERIAQELQELFDKPDAIDILPHYLREYIDRLTGEAK